MLVIRFARTGKKKQAYFRIVVQEKERAVGAKFVEILGNYDPHAKKLTVNKERLEHFLSNGAQPSNTLAKLIAKEGIKLPKWVKITEKKRAPKKEPEAPKAVEKEEAATQEVKDEEAVESSQPAESNEATVEAPAKEAESTEPVESIEPAEAAEEVPADANEPAESAESSESAEAAEVTEEQKEGNVETPEEDKNN